MFRNRIASIVGLLLVGFLPAGTGLAGESAPSQPNILLLIGDDIGVEALASYGIGSDPARTPNLDALAAGGTQFANTWSQPACSPTRATLLTGRFGFRTGVGMPSGGEGVDGPLLEVPPPQDGSPREYKEDFSKVVRSVFPSSINSLRRKGKLTPDAMRRSGLPPSEVGLPTALKNAAPEYQTAAIGKWHLGDVRNGWLKHPQQAGFDYYSVLPGNVVPSYFSWQENDNGELGLRKGYTADAKLADAHAWIREQGKKPWFLWYAFNLPHTPFFVPQGSDLPQPDVLTANELDNPQAYFDLMVEEMDRKIGELLDGMDQATRENTVVIFIGDNGSALTAIDPPFDPNRSKFSLYQGGIHVPLIIEGPGIRQGVTSSALANTTDIYATILDLASSSNHAVPVPEDSLSLAPLLTDADSVGPRRFAYADRLFANLGIEHGDFTIRDERYKLIQYDGRRELYDLASDAYEKNDLLLAKLSIQQQKALDELAAAAAELHGRDATENVK